MNHEVASHKNGENDLGELTGLISEWTDLDPKRGSVDGVPNNGEEWHEEQQHTEKQRDVGVSLQLSVVANNQEDDAQ